MNPPSPQKHSGFATASLFMALLSILPIVGLIFFITALIFGFWALDDVKREHSTGKAMAATAIGLSMFLTIINIAMVCVIAERSNISLVNYREIIQQVKNAHKRSE